MLNIVTATRGRGAVAAPSKNEVGQIINVSLVKRWGKYVRFLKILTPSKNFLTPHPQKKMEVKFLSLSYAYCMLSSVSTEKVFTYSSLGNYFSVPENSVTILETS